MFGIEEVVIVRLSPELQRWVRKMQAGGMQPDAVATLFAAVMQELQEQLVQAGFSVTPHGVDAYASQTYPTPMAPPTRPAASATIYQLPRQFSPAGYASYFTEPERNRSLPGRTSPRIPSATAHLSQ